MADNAASALLPVLIDEIRRLKEVHALAAGVTELPVADAVVRSELALMRSEFVQLKGLFGLGATSAKMPGATPATSETTEQEKQQVVRQVHEQEEEITPARRPRLNSVSISGPLALPEGCETHYFLR